MYYRILLLLSTLQLCNFASFSQTQTKQDLQQQFASPPPGYGEVPFWWWSGDPLNKERLLWQIEELHKKGVSGMQVNYMHQDSPGWPTYPAEPEIFSDPWWEFWKFAAEECRKRDMGLGLSGYTLDWPKSDNLFNRLIYNNPEIQGRAIRIDTTIQVSAGKQIRLNIPKESIGVWAYPLQDGLLINGGKDLAPWINQGILNWKADSDLWEIWVFTAERESGTLNPIHPKAGQTVIDKFFQPFEDQAIDVSAKGLNYFFQDEVHFGVGDVIWTDDFREEFKKRKGYEVFEILPALFVEMGNITSKARLDFLDVKVSLSEERYFIPIFNWHHSRGMIYGCDPNGRGLNPGEYGDNFRIQRWYTAPGHDTPGGNADLIKGKVSSSIANLYKRPRVWLEGYHSLGWGATPERLMYATNENYLYGCNLLNLHGLYYTTHGSFWEWAPPCYHFRMPYWEHMPVFFSYFERLSYLLSQGHLQADIALMYPVSPVQARLDGQAATDTAFAAGRKLFGSGYDFIFMDDQSLERSEIKKNIFSVADMDFKVLILPGMKAIRWTSLQKALEFYRNGGTVLNIGPLPEASDHAGSNDPDLEKLVRELFGAAASDTLHQQYPSIQTNPAGGLGIALKNTDDLLSQIKKQLPLVLQSSPQVRFMHRKIDDQEIFFIMDAKKDSWCTFQAKGTPERWDPWTGKTYPLETIQTAKGIKIKMPLDSTEAQLIVFSTPAREIGDSSFENRKSKIENRKVLTLLSPWRFQLQPTMNNHWGDFRLPVTEEVIGAEARIFRYAEETDSAPGWEKPEFQDSAWQKVSHGFGQKFWKIGPVPNKSGLRAWERRISRLNQINPSKALKFRGKTYQWEPYEFSWRWGKEGDPGHQGYHGLKEEVSDEFICLGKPTGGLNETLYQEEEEGTRYYLWTQAFANESLIASSDFENPSNSQAQLIPAAVYLNGKNHKRTIQKLPLQHGPNPLLVRYDQPGRGHFVLLNKDSKGPEGRTPLSMRWLDEPGRIPFDVRGSEQTPIGWYRFDAPPGLKRLRIRAHGQIQVWIDGLKHQVYLEEAGTPSKYHVILRNSIAESSLVAIRIEQTRGDYGGAALPEPILLECEEGLTALGDWSAGSVLENYSGGAWYRNTFYLEADEISPSAWLDLGELVATAEVRINGRDAGILVAPPWKLDISGLLQPGENQIEILVYNTLANHYQTIPTKYKGNSLKSGLIGPVQIVLKD